MSHDDDLRNVLDGRLESLMLEFIGSVEIYTTIINANWRFHEEKINRAISVHHFMLSIH